jgi:hypothetical protein
MVIGTTGAPLPQAEVRVPGQGRTTLTDAEGRFALSAVPSGTHTMFVAKVGYAPESFDLTTGDLAEVTVRVTLAEAAKTELAEVRTEAKPGSMLMSSFWARKEKESGVFLTRKDIREFGSSNTAELLRMVPGVRLRTVGANQTNTKIEFDRCRFIAVFIDGVESRGSDAGDVLRMVDPRSIEAMEVYTSASKIPATFRTLDKCAAIAIWTRIN